MNKWSKVIRRRVLSAVLVTTLVFSNVTVYADNMETTQSVVETEVTTETSETTESVVKEETAESKETVVSVETEVAAVETAESETIESEVKEESKESEALLNADYKTMIYDFGAQEFDGVNNMLTANVINGWYEGVEPGTTGKNLKSFDQVYDIDLDGEAEYELVFNDGGYPTTHRLRSSNTAITRYDAKEMFAGEGDSSEVLTGFIYSNKSKTDAVYVAVKGYEGDMITAYVGSNSGNSTITVESPSGEKTNFSHEYASANSRAKATVFTFYPVEEGMYKIYTLDEKLLLARIAQTHSEKASVHGTVKMPATMSNDFSLVFTNESSKAQTEVAVSADGTYETELFDQYTYSVALKNANGYVITEGTELQCLGAGSDISFDITVSSVSLLEMTGEIKGLSEEALKNLSISLVADEIYVPSVTINGSSYTCKVESGVSYTVDYQGVEDYILVSSETISLTEEKTVDFVFEEKTKYPVTIELEGASKEDLKEATFTFTRHSDEDVTVEENQVYSFTGTENIALRDGVYTVKVTGSGDYKQKLTSNLTVAGKAVTKTVRFEFTGAKNQSKTWEFTTAEYTGQAEYEGLVITNGQKHSTNYGMMIKNGTILVPVSGPCTIKVNVGYNWDITFDEEETNYLETSNSDAVLEYAYNGGEGNVTITAGSKATSYIRSIEVSYKNNTEVKDVYEVTVGATGCDYTSINDALKAIKGFDRSNSQRAIIKIAPGNYEEMLVIDEPNITLVNASEKADTVLSNKGVSISENAVRITSYYGHGYTYYSMGSDCKYSDEILEVNKENGYASFENPGSGTTNGSYWNATVVVNASGFEAQNIIFENSFNQYVSEKAAKDIIVKQSGAKEGTVARASMEAFDTTVQNKKYVERAAALAIANNANNLSFTGCKFIGRQDTLYGGTNVTAGFYNCDIFGGTDYIFGGMTAVFAKCNLVANTMEDANDTFYITAAQQKAGRGYLMYNCTVTSTTPGVDTASETVSKAGYFGRPWQANTSEVVFYNTVVETANDGSSLIAATGWNSTLGGTSDCVYEYNTVEKSGVDNKAKRAAWSKVLETPVLSDGTEISVKAFLGDFDPFEGKDMTISLPEVGGSTGEEEKPEEKPETPVESAEYELDASLLKAMAAGSKADGDSEKAGTQDYFTLIFSAKSKIDASTKTFEDEYASSQRINFGGLASTEKNAVKFTTEGKAKVKVWWVEGGDDNRQMALLNSANEVVAQTDVTVAKNATVISTLEVAEAGTYYLGGLTNNNYIFKVVVTEEKEVVAEPFTMSLDTTADLEAFVQGAKADGEALKVGTDDYFTILFSAKSKVDASKKAFDDGYAPTQRLNLGGVVSTEKNAIMFTTQNPSSVKIWWAEGGDDNRQIAILDGAGSQVAVTEDTVAKNAVCISTLELADAGTYFLGSTPNNNYIFKVEVTETPTGAAKPERASWTSVSAPVITNVETNKENKNELLVSVKAVVGYNGGDKVVVTLTDKDGNEVATKNSLKESDAHVVAFTPAASGTYTATAALVREGSEDKTSKEATAEFVLPLVTPVISSVTSLGNGKAKVKWGAVKEASKYVVSTKENPEIQVETKELSCVLEGLTVDTVYTFTVKAVRGEEITKAGELSKLVSKDAQVEWNFSAYGSSVTSSKDGYKGDLYEGNLKVFSTGNGGKIVPNSTDGLAFYYTEIPSDQNFTLEATVAVDSWTFSNGQEGFGLMATDRVGVNGDGAAFWNNSYQAIVGKVEYFYDTEKKEVSDAGEKITMKLGVGSIEKQGVTAAGLDELAQGATIPSAFTTKTTTLETSVVDAGKLQGSYNIIGNCTNTPDNSIKALTEFKLKIRKNNTGYFVSYTDEDGVEHTNKYYDTEALSQLDAAVVNVGFFASRNATISIKDYSLSVIDPSMDDPKEERPKTMVTPQFSVLSSNVSNSESYELVFSANWNGKLIIKDAEGKVLVEKEDVVAKEKIKCDTTLKLGNNDFTVSYTPDESYAPNEFSALSSYETVTFTHTVNYQRFGEAGRSLYVTPNGSFEGTGTKENPLDIYTAVKYVQAGQTIVLAGGVYELSKTVTVERGIDGTADARIYMVADPEANQRPVLDFGGRCAGMVLAGNYWTFKGFDVTRSANGMKGIQLSGSNNILDQLNTYKNGNTGIQIARYLVTDSGKNDGWPANNLVLNCTSYLNADAGYEDADGFAAKLTIGEGNVFDGCISAYNADDGWDCFAKAETGAIGKVTIQNCIAYRNGYVLKNEAGELDINGALVNAGNGNGFKMGGESITGHHEVKNSLAFYNKAKGIDSNSCPDISANNCVSFNNESYNVAFYTNNAANTDFSANGVISFRTEFMDVAEQIKVKGTQDTTKIYGTSNYFYDTESKTSKNTEGEVVTSDWFVSLDFASVDRTFARKADGSIEMNGFLQLKEEYVSKTDAVIGGTASGEVVPPAIVDEPKPAEVPATPVVSNQVQVVAQVVAQVVVKVVKKIIGRIIKIFG